MVSEYLDQFGQATPGDIEALLLDKLPEVLDQEQKITEADATDEMFYRKYQKMDPEVKKKIRKRKRGNSLSRMTASRCPKKMPNVF